MKAKIIYFTVLTIIGVSMFIGGAIWKEVTTRYSDIIGTALIVAGSIIGFLGLVLSATFVCLS